MNQFKHHTSNYKTSALDFPVFIQNHTPQITFWFWFSITVLALIFLQIISTHSVYTTLILPYKSWLTKHMRKIFSRIIKIGLPTLALKTARKWPTLLCNMFSRKKLIPQMAQKRFFWRPSNAQNVHITSDER